MIYLYLWSAGTLATLITFMIFLLIIQTIVTIYGCFRFRPGNAHICRNYLEILIFLWILILIRIVADICFRSGDGYSSFEALPRTRIFLFFLLLPMALLTGRQEHHHSPIVVPVVAALGLPLGEQLFGNRYPYVFLGTLFFWLLHALHVYLLYYYERKHLLSRFSIKEAIDTMDFGILFYHSAGSARGTILLQNNKMQELMYQTTGKLSRNGCTFYENLEKGKLLSSCQRSQLNDQTAVILPDQSMWTFERHELQVGKTAYTMLVAYNSTKYWNATFDFYEKNKKLEIRNTELMQMMENLDTICKTEETIQAKNKVHDVLGQRISLLLRSIREHKEPDEKLLAAFAEGLPSELKDVSACNRYSLNTLKEIFKGLGVILILDGDLPKNPRLSKAFYEISAEATTNAVRHGYASQIHIRICHEKSRWILAIDDNGLPTDKPVTEGGGLTEMRRKVDRLNGNFSYFADSGFHIHIEIPEGENYV